MTSKTDLISALEQRAQALLQKLEEYQTIETEYRQTVRALNVFKGESVNLIKAKVPASSNGNAQPQENLIQVCLRLVSQAPKGLTVDAVWSASQVAKRNSVYQSLRRLFRTGLLSDHGGTYSITKRGLEKLSRVESSHESPAPPRHPRPARPVAATSTSALACLAQHPNGLRPSQVADALGLEGRRERNRLSVIMPYLRKIGKATSEKGERGVIYKITATGRTEVASSLAQGA